MNGGYQLEIEKIVSGGQTGVDRGALDAAIDMGIPHGGWCPRGRLSENGRIPRRYNLSESQSSEYWVRTERNVVDSNGTLILYWNSMSGGTAFTQRMAIKHQRPVFQVDLARDLNVHAVRDWIETNGINVLNVAGPRESSCPGIAEQAKHFVISVVRD